jgi:transcriptional regulator with XRE-family HTH domain
MQRPVLLPGGLTWFYDRIEALGFASLSDFAKQADMHKGNLYRYFSHETKPSVAVLPKLCSALEVEVDVVLKHLGVQVTEDKNF